MGNVILFPAVNSKSESTVTIPRRVRIRPIKVLKLQSRLRASSIEAMVLRLTQAIASFA
jgi:hypothetical protein